MTIHKTIGNSFWGTKSVCGLDLNKGNDHEHNKTGVWRNVNCDVCKQSQRYIIWSKMNPKEKVISG